MMNTRKKFLSQYALYITAFFIPFILMMIIFMVQSIYPFGDRSFLHIDMYHQYFPFLNEFYHKLKAGESLFYSWNTGIGSNFLALFVYYLSSPFNWLCVLVPEHLLIEFQSYLVVFKIGLCGFTSCYYFRHHFKTKSPALLLFTTFYALSGFMAAYNWNVMWLDCVVLAPIIILGLERLVLEGKDKLYCITLALAILCNYYLCIMICIYLVLYFLLVLLPEAPNKFRACKQFAITSLLGGGMAAILLIPEAMALRLTEFSGATFPSVTKSYFAIFDVIARHSMDVAVEIGLDHWPNLYAGVAVLALLPLYIICKTIPTKQKMGKLVLLLFFIISFSTNSLNFIWHGMNYPDSLPCRQSFLYILLLLKVCLETFLHIKEISKTDVSRIFLGVFIFLIFCQKLVTDDAFTNRSFLLSGVFLLGYAFLLHLYRDVEKTPRPLLFAALLLVMLEAGFNTYLTSCPTVSRTSYLSDYDSYQPLTDSVKTETDLVRFERDSRVTNNDAMLFQYPSASLFSSTSNGLVNAFYETYGLQSSKVFYSYNGATPFTSALLNVSYSISKSDSKANDLQQLLSQEDNLYLYHNDTSLPFGYMVWVENMTDEEIQEESASASSQETDETEPALDELTELFVDSEYAQNVVLNKELANTRTSIVPLKRQNTLAKRLGASEDIFLPVEVANTGDTAIITVSQDGHYYGYSQNSKVASATLNIQTANGENPKPVTFKKMKNRYILDLGYCNAGDILTITAADSKDIKLCAYKFEEEPFDALIADLSSQSFQISSFESTKITGTVNATENGYLVLSMPYEPGWSITVDGEKCEAKLFEGMFLSIPLSKGEHSISLHYMPEGFVSGVIVSIVCMGLFGVYCWIGRKKIGVSIK